MVVVASNQRTIKQVISNFPPNSERAKRITHFYYYYYYYYKSCMEMYTQKIVASCSNNRFRIESLTSESESNRIVRCQEIPTLNWKHCRKDVTQYRITAFTYLWHQVPSAVLLRSKHWVCRSTSWYLICNALDWDLKTKTGQHQDIPGLLWRSVCCTVAVCH